MNLKQEREDIEVRCPDCGTHFVWSRMKKDRTEVVELKGVLREILEADPRFGTGTRGMGAVVKARGLLEE